MNRWEPSMWVGGFQISSTREASIWEDADSVEPAGTRFNVVWTVREYIEEWMYLSQKSYRESH